MIKRMVIVLLLLALVLGAMFGWKYVQMQQMAALANMPPPPASVATAEVQTEQWQPYLTAVGSLVASRGILVTTEVAGKVSAIHFESGQQVEAGTLLLQLDSSVDRAELQGIVAERRLAEQQYKRREELLDSKTISRSDVDEARLRVDNAKAQVAARQAIIGKMNITAPFAGWLGIRPSYRWRRWIRSTWTFPSRNAISIKSRLASRWKSKYRPFRAKCLRDRSRP